MEWRPNQPFDEDDECDDNYEPLVIDGEDNIELEVDDTNKDTDNDGTITQDLSQVDLPVTELVPEHITQPQLEDAEVGTLGEEELNIEEEGVAHVEEEGVAHVEEEGVAHMEEEGADQVEEEGVSTDMGEGENSIGNNEEATQRGGYNLRSNRSREYSHRFDPQVYDVTNTHVSHATRKPVTIAQNMFGFVFTQMTAGADKEFECLRESLGNVSLEICGPDEHIPEVECSIRTMKETMRATAHGLPYRCLPKLMIVKLVAMATRCLNGFPKDDGVSEHMSPHSIITRQARMDYNKIALEFGSYVQLLDRSVNTICSRTISAIALNPTGDENGTYRFMSLKTGQVLTKGPGSWTEVPITDIAIARVEALAKQEGQPLI